LTNTSNIALTSVALQLPAPDGWQVSQLTGPSSATLKPAGGQATATYRVTAPAATVPISTATLTAQASYTGHGTTQTTTAPLTLRVVSPLAATYRTANTSGADAVFGQLGSDLAISAAGVNVGPATGGAGGTTPAGDAYGAIYLPGGLGSTGTLTATVTSQGGGSTGKAGIMARNVMSASGTPVGVALYVNNGRAVLVYNNTASGGTAYTTRIANGSLAYSVQLKLVRTGSTYVGSYSTGGAWTTVGTVTANGQASTQDAGVFQSSGLASTPALASFTGLAASA
jgi:alpha-N-acetylglucosaminidase